METDKLEETYLEDIVVKLFFLERWSGEVGVDSLDFTTNLSTK